MQSLRQGFLRQWLTEGVLSGKTCKGVREKSRVRKSQVSCVCSWRLALAYPLGNSRWRMTAQSFPTWRQGGTLLGSLYQSVIGYRPPLELTCNLPGLSGTDISIHWSQFTGDNEGGGAASCCSHLQQLGVECHWLVKRIWAGHQKCCLHGRQLDASGGQRLYLICFYICYSFSIQSCIQQWFMVCHLSAKHYYSLIIHQWVESRPFPHGACIPVGER